MSAWTYIEGCIKVDVPGRTQHEIEYILKTVLDHLPRVTGSERDMVVYTNREVGFNTSSSCDEFGFRTDNLVDMYGDKSRRHGWMRYNNNYYITVTGSLRDRYFDETYKEFMKWICRLSKRLSVTSILVRIKGIKNGKYVTKVIDDDEPFWQMYEWPSWANKEHEPAWWEYLMWDSAKGSFMPMKLKYKYIEDEENDAMVEALRRYYEK